MLDCTPAHPPVCCRNSTLVAEARNPGSQFCCVGVGGHIDIYMSVVFRVIPRCVCKEPVVTVCCADVGRYICIAEGCLGSFHLILHACRSKEFVVAVPTCGACVQCHGFRGVCVLCRRALAREKFVLCRHALAKEKSLSRLRLLCIWNRFYVFS